ncbi:MAG: M56 family metallopeptidase [Candidatus Faecousia sp.]|nr:M56 family metallopeptidase [Candidatus Faecousia sp.]
MESLFSNILTASFHGSIVILVVMVLRVLLKKAPRKYICFLWLLAGLRLLMPFEIQSSLSLQPMPETSQVQQWQAPAAVPAGEAGGEALPEAPAPRQEASQPVAGEAAQSDAPVSAAPRVSAKSAGNWKKNLPFVWLSVALCFGIYTLYSYLSLKNKVREAVKIRGGWECDRIDTAFILGFIRPKIYIPMGLSPTVRKHVLAHERTHLEKGDHWFKMVGFLALALHWFNPLVWIAYVLLCKDIEVACDERVVQFMDLEERKSYSAALLSCSTNRATSPPVPWPSGRSA